MATVETEAEKWKLYQKEVPIKGRAVFAGVPIPAGQLVIKFEGPVFTKETCPDFSEALQVGLNAWMWSSGGLDDLVNHSCNPNMGLLPVGGDVYLASLRPVAQDEELSFDYTTSMVDEPWAMECACGEATCRGVIANFLDTTPEVQHRYARIGTLCEHVVHAYLTRGAGLAAGLKQMEVDAASPVAPLLAASRLPSVTVLPPATAGSSPAAVAAAADKHASAPVTAAAAVAAV